MLCNQKELSIESFSVTYYLSSYTARSSSCLSTEYLETFIAASAYLQFP